MFQIKNFKPREYQKEIFETSKEKNTLICLPTGTGKTFNILLLSLYRLNKVKDSKIAIVSPTRPLNAQHLRTFQEYTNINPKDIILLTGQIKPEKRKELYHKKIIIATPQTLKEDLINNRFSFKNFSLLAFDEAHRAIGQYAYTFLSKQYLKQSEFPRILALTASPGGTKAKIDEIQENLNIGAVEIRTEQDIKEYIQEKKLNWIKVELPESLKQLHKQIKEVYKIKLKDLQKLGISKPLYLISKRDLLQMQKQFQQEIQNKNPLAYYGISLTSELIKLDYASELLETQSLSSLQQFWKKLQTDPSKAAKNILNNSNIIKAINLTSLLLKKNIQHPKLDTLKSVIQKELQKNPKAKIIVFANYRNTVDLIISSLENIKNIKPTKLIGQKKGLKQSEQIQTIKDFETGIYNVMAGTQVIEEGLSIEGGAELAIFYDITSSEIRKLQRSGRVGRTKSGKIIFLLTKNTREEGYYWSAHKKEKIMKKTLHNLQKKSNKKENQKSLTNY